MKEEVFRKSLKSDYVDVGEIQRRFIYVSESLKEIQRKINSFARFTKGKSPKGVSAVIVQCSEVPQNERCLHLHDGSIILLKVGLNILTVNQYPQLKYGFCGRFSDDPTMTGINSIDLSYFDCSNLTTTRDMFLGMANLRVCILDNLDTSKVTDMSNMFNSCGLEYVDLSGLDTSNVVNMDGMFCNTDFIELDLSNFDMRNVKSVDNMLHTNAIVVNISNWTICHSMQGLLSDDWFVEYIITDNLSYNAERLLKASAENTRTTIL